MSLAARLMESGQLKLAESYIRSALAKAPFDAELLFDAANLKRAQGNIDGCRELLGQIDETSGVGRKARILLDILAQCLVRDPAEDAIQPVPFARVENVLSDAAIGEMLAFVLANEHRFGDSKAKAADGNYSDARQSKVWQRVTGLPVALEKIVAKAVAANATRLGVQQPVTEAFEIEIGAYRDGDVFTPHLDRGEGIARIRRITTLFYFYAVPARFSGGDLRLYDSGTNGDFDPAAWTSFQPTNNSLLQFRSDAIHAVSPVSGPQCFADNRFCLTFWALERH
jgi:SM-20-related protein